MIQEMKSHIARESLEYSYRTLAGAALLGGLVACVSMMLGHWPLVALCYFAATVARIGAGAVMNRMGDAETVNAWNYRYHRFVVIVLNAVVGAVLLVRLAWDAFRHHEHIVPFAFLVCAFVAYFVAAKFTKPNTFGARVRSAMLTVVLIATMAHLARWIDFRMGYVWLPTLVVVWGRLRALQRRFGWADR